MQKIAGKPYYRVDELWGKGDLALEYESDEFHNNAYQAPRDRRRRNILQHIGIRVITVNTSQLKNLMEVDNLADQILKHLGRRQHPLPTEYQRKHAQFHRELIRIDPVFRL